MTLVTNTPNVEILRSRYIVVIIIYHIFRICTCGTAWFALLGDACCTDFDLSNVLMCSYIYLYTHIIYIYTHIYVYIHIYTYHKVFSV